MLASRRLRVLISPIYVSGGNTPAPMRIGSALTLQAAEPALHMALAKLVVKLLEKRQRLAIGRARLVVAPVCREDR